MERLPSRPHCASPAQRGPDRGRPIHGSQHAHVTRRTGGLGPARRSDFPLPRRRIRTRPRPGRPQRRTRGPPRKQSAGAKAARRDDAPRPSVACEGHGACEGQDTCDGQDTCRRPPRRGQRPTEDGPPEEGRPRGRSATEDPGRPGHVSKGQAREDDCCEHTTPENDPTTTAPSSAAAKKAPGPRRLAARKAAARRTGSAKVRLLDRRRHRSASWRSRRARRAWTKAELKEVLDELHEQRDHSARRSSRQQETELDRADAGLR